MTSIIKPGYDDNRKILAEVIPLKTPFVIQIAPSSRCNLKCSYCIQSSSDMENRCLMEWSTFLKICNQIKEFDEKLKQINIAGWGEPLTNKRLPLMILHIKKLNITEKVSVITNGYLLNQEYSLSLINSGADFIKISLQGMTSDRYKEISGVNINFDNLVAKIKFLYNNKKNCQVYVKIADIALSKDEEQLFYSTFGEITDRMYIENIRPIFDNGDNKPINKYGQIHPPIMVCPQPFFMMNVTSSGDISPCCSYYDPTKFGNINNSTLKETWCSDNMKNFQKMMLSKDRNTQKKYPVCNRCKIPDVIVLPGDELDHYA